MSGDRPWGAEGSGVPDAAPPSDPASAPPTPVSVPPTPGYGPPGGYWSGQGYAPPTGQPAAGIPPAPSWAGQGYQSPAGYWAAPGTPPQFAAGPPGPPAYWTTTPPPPLSDQPPPRRPPSRRGWLVALLMVVGLVLAGLVTTLGVPHLAALQAPGRKHSPAATPTSSASAKPTASPKPSSSPTPTMPSDPKAVLRKNPVYALAAPAKCPSQHIPASAAAFRTQVKALVSCENSAWKKALAGGPVAFAKPRVTFYGTSTKSPCGQLGTTFPAAYCTSDRTLYFSTAAYSQGRYYRLAVAQFVMHEYAHHIQELAGIFDASWAMDEGESVTTRRIELQAHCMAHYQLTHSSLGFGYRDRADAEFQFSYTTDAKGHGSTTAERYWGRRGLAAGTIGACNTWKVKASRVK